MSLRLRCQRGLTIVDTIITLCLIGILIGIVIPKYQQMAHDAQETALKMGLSNIRTSIRLFRMMNGQNPKSLHELIEKDVMVSAGAGKDSYTGSLFTQKYLMHQVFDAKGNVLDSFGNPFTYDRIQGEVRSTTQGYAAW